jgi:periplasmic protein TonB
MKLVVCVSLVLHAALFAAAIEIKTKSIPPLSLPATHRVMEMQLGKAPHCATQIHVSPKELNDVSKAPSTEALVTAAPVINLKLDSVASTAAENPEFSTNVLSDMNNASTAGFVMAMAASSMPLVVGNRNAAHGHTTSLADTLPYILVSPPPVYPREARSKGWTGRVRVRVLISEQGIVQDAEIAGSSGHAVLDDAALRALRQWQFHPVCKDGQAVAAWVVVPVLFRLD